MVENGDTPFIFIKRVSSVFLIDQTILPQTIENTNLPCNGKQTKGRLFDSRKI